MMDLAPCPEVNRGRYIEVFDSAMMDLAPCPEVNRGRYIEVFDFACPVTLFLAYMAVTLNKFKFSE